tara:strand:- start:44 stop:415 length:372 start_codon:yes stop_codon:yes gene_type:complete
MAKRKGTMASSIKAIAKEVAKMKKPTIAEIKRTTKKDSPSYFDARTMKMFKQTMKSFKVHKSRKGNFFIYSKGYSYDSRDGKWYFMGYSIRRYVPDGMNSKLTYVSVPYGELKTDADVKKYLG